jgi:hypothetical protein
MKQRGAKVMKIYLLLVGLTALSCAPINGSAQNWRQAQLRDLCVTEGRVTEFSTGYLGIRDARTRAVLGFKTPQTAELFFRYLGPTADQVPLESGTVRTQIGLKMRAEDGCNLVYVMWRILPVPELVVSIKSNPGQRTFAECQDRGYHNVTPDKLISIPAFKVGNAHSIRAVLDGTRLSVNADGQLAWDGELDASAFRFNGPVGFRTDNGQFDAQFFAFQPEVGTIACPKSAPE